MSGEKLCGLVLAVTSQFNADSQQGAAVVFFRHASSTCLPSFKAYRSFCSCVDCLRFARRPLNQWNASEVNQGMLVSFLLAIPRETPFLSPGCAMRSCPAGLSPGSLAVARQSFQVTHLINGSTAPLRCFSRFHGPCTGTGWSVLHMNS